MNMSRGTNIVILPTNQSQLEEIILSGTGQFHSTATHILASIQSLPAKLTIVVVAFLQRGHLFTTN